MRRDRSPRRAPSRAGAALLGLAALGVAVAVAAPGLSSMAARGDPIAGAVRAAGATPGPATQEDRGSLEYIAHAAFRIRSPGGTELLIDPYASGVWLGYDFPSGLDPDAILITHPHYDHDGGRFQGRDPWWDEDTRVIDAPGRYEIGDVTVHGIRGKHADPYGEEFGQRNTIMVIEVAGVRLAHVGDNGPLTAANVRRMGSIDVLMLPIDGDEHILSDGAVDDAIGAVRPRVVVPMHYRIPELESSPDSPADLGEIDPWLEGRSDVERVAGNAMPLGRDALPDSPTVVVLRHSPGLPGAGSRRDEARGGVDAADSIVARWVEDERVPGAVLLVSRGGRVAIERAYGWARLYEYGKGQYGAREADGSRPAAIRRLDDPRPMTVDTVFDLASVTKVMATTFAVMLLVDAGDLELDAPVRAYLPDFTGGGKDRITLRHLLTHRAGLHPWKPVYYAARDAGRAYEYVRDLPLAWEVGEERHYSDLGFMILALVVERVAGAPLEVFLQERLYGPLGLTATGFRPAGGATAPPAPGATASTGVAGAPGPGGPFAATSHGNPFEHRMVHDPDFGYRYEGNPDAWNGWRERTLMGEVNDGNAYHAFDGAAGHAGLFSTAGDLHVLLRLLLERGVHDGHRYLGAEVVEAFLTPHDDGQALGWQIPEEGPAGSFFHPGFTGTWVLAVPADDLAVVLLTNRQNVGVDADGRYPDLAELQRDLARAVLQP